MNESIIKHYANLFYKYGDTAESAQWSSRESQERRFEILVAIGCLTDCHILDFGCGTGHLFTYLNQNHHKIASYTGVDIVPELLEAGKIKYTGYTNVRFGLFEEFAQEHFDYVFVSGVFNNQRPTNQDFYKSTIIRLFKMCKRGLAFNMLSSFVDYYDPNLFYEDPSVVLHFLKSDITPFVVLRHDYQVKSGVVPYEFTFYALKQPEWENQ